MFVNETKCFYVMYHAKETGKNSEKKKEFFEKSMAHLGAKQITVCKAVWSLEDVVYSSASDILDIVSSEMIRFAGQDSATSANKNDFEFKKNEDNVVISEYNKDNTTSI